MYLFLILFAFYAVAAAQPDKSIVGEITIPAPVEDVYNVWSTEEGAKTFFAPDCKIELEPYGAYEMYFMPDAEPGSRGGEGCKVLAFEKNKMLSFTWNTPPAFPELRKMYTHVTLYFTSEGNNQTKVKLIHDGWGADGDWNKAYEYFSGAWLKVLFPRLKYRFENGPVDWTNPPKLN